jgi:sugar phosphate isomerase/epimerase
MTKYKPMLAAEGIRLAYHNHDGEFKPNKDGQIAHEEMERRTDIDFQIDTFWAFVAGRDPIEVITRLKDRVPVIHLKDCAWGQQMAVVGEGNINFDRVFEKAAAGGTQYMMVEQDNCNGEDPIECLRRSYNFLKANGFE